MLDVYLAAIGALALVLAFASRRVRELPLSEPLCGLALGVLIGPLGAGFVVLPQADAVLREAARLLLAVSLMAIALRYPLGQLRRHLWPVVLLLGVVLPLMAAVGALLAAVLLGLPAAAAWLLGACLAPTDPVLSSSIVTGEPAERLVPERLRQLLSAESAANDGLGLPFVAAGVVLVTGAPASRLWLDAGYGVAAGAVIGLALGWLAGRAMRTAHERADVESSAELVFSLVLALFVLGAAKLVQTDGILAVFVAGLAYNAAVTGAQRRPEQTIDEGVNRFVVLPTFTLLGVALPWSEWVALGWAGVAFVAALLVLRRLPAVVALRRPLVLDRPAALFYGWFGPIGVAALYYLTHARHQGVVDPRLWAAGSLAVAASVVAHGVTGAPGRRRYAASAGGGGGDG